MSTIKKLFVALTLVLFVAGYSQAQYKPVNTNFDGPMPEVKKGSRSFIFTYTPFQSNLGSVYAGSYTSASGTNYDELSQIDLYGIGFQYYVSNNVSLGGGIQFGSTSVNGVDSTNLQAPGTDFSATTFGISLDVNYHFRSLYSVSPYLGLNLNYGNYSSTTTPLASNSTATDTKGSSFGAGVNFGFDWYFTEGISLGGRYTLGFRQWSAPEQTTGNNTLTGPDGNRIGTGIMSVLMNVHL
ncbi:MAG: outer membrane beta-barrel protein [Ignavibacteriae bacterium]|nr:outer membrane beta-barrel protein [Ignavibacteriota bacterium]MCB9242777.1 outer membrane beta-barrel protein [Ignavibacteriales bacterium]